MKRGCGQGKLFTCTQILLVFDIFRAIIIASLLIGIFCGLSSVNLYKFNEEIWTGTTIRVDYYKMREIMVACIVIGITICGVDVILAISLDYILTFKRTRREWFWWNACAIASLFLRNGFYASIPAFTFEKSIGLQRMSEFTPGIDVSFKFLYYAGVGYEVVKLVEFFLAIIVWNDLKSDMEQEPLDYKIISVKGTAKPGLLKRQ